jgi:hypothetical protein
MMCRVISMFWSVAWAIANSTVPRSCGGGPLNSATMMLPSADAQADRVRKSQTILKRAAPRAEKRSGAPECPPRRNSESVTLWRLLAVPAFTRSRRSSAWRLARFSGSRTVRMARRDAGRYRPELRGGRHDDSITNRRACSGGLVRAQHDCRARARWALPGPR